MRLWGCADMPCYLCRIAAAIRSRWSFMGRDRRSIHHEWAQCEWDFLSAFRLLKRRPRNRADRAPFNLYLLRFCVTLFLETVRHKLFALVVQIWGGPVYSPRTFICFDMFLLHEHNGWFLSGSFRSLPQFQGNRCRNPHPCKLIECVRTRDLRRHPMQQFTGIESLLGQPQRTSDYFHLFFRKLTGVAAETVAFWGLIGDSDLSDYVLGW